MNISQLMVVRLKHTLLGHCIFPVYTMSPDFGLWPASFLFWKWRMGLSMKRVDYYV